MDSVACHNNIITSCESILKELNPRFAKEKERDEDINNLKDKMGFLPFPRCKPHCPISKLKTYYKFYRLINCKVLV